MKQISFEEAVTVLSKGGIVFQQYPGDYPKQRMKLSDVDSHLLLCRDSIYYIPTTIEHAVFKYVGPAGTAHTKYVTFLREHSNYITKVYKQVSPWVTVEVEE